VARHGVGDALLQAAQEFPAHALRAFLVQWRECLREVLQTDPKGYIGHRCPALAGSVTDAFPDLTILSAYATPLTSWSGGLVPQIPDITLKEPNLTELASFCERRFGWGCTVHDRFKSVIWEGAVLRKLCKVRSPVSWDEISD